MKYTRLYFYLFNNIHAQVPIDQSEDMFFVNAPSGYDDTDFDSKALGMWRNVGQIQWRRNKYFTKTVDTGPNRDHTTGKGEVKV